MNGEILYKKIYEDIVAKIKSGEYKNGDFLPKQETLSKNYNVSLITVKKALEYAEEKGVVSRCKGRRAQINNLIFRTFDYKVLLLTVLGKKRENIKVDNIPDGKVKLNIQNSWISIITKSLLSELPENIDFLSAAYYRDEIISDYENTVITNYDRIVLIGSKSRSLIDFLNSKGKKIAVFGNSNVENCAIVSNNDREISRSAVKYLISIGHKRIAFIGTNVSDGDFAERYKGYQDAHAMCNLPVNGALLRWCKHATSNEGYNSMVDILVTSYRYEGRPTAVFCGNDNLAYGALKAIQESGLRCPEDISIIGVDNCLEICNSTVPQISSVDKNFELAGKQLAKVLLREKWQNDVSTIKCNLVIRDSVQEIN